MPSPRNPKFEPSALQEQFFAQVSESLQMVFDLASRVDERVKNIATRQEELEGRVEKVTETQTELIKQLSILQTQDYDEIQAEMGDLNKKVAVLQNEGDKKEIEALRQSGQELRNLLHALELKFEGIHLRLGHHDTRWQRTLDAVWKLALTLIAGWILYKLGLK